ncbi:hypothetical protein ACW9HQ_51465, partial [Nocardia gipuzkoensis]
PVQTAPGWLRVFAENQPLTVVIQADRCLTQGPRDSVDSDTPAPITSRRRWPGVSVSSCSPSLPLCWCFGGAEHRRYKGDEGLCRIA